MLRSERTAFEVASFLVGKVSGGSIEKVVKGDELADASQEANGESSSV